MELLSRLLDKLSETIKAWERFNSSNGDIGYFSDSSISQNRAKSLSLRAIKKTFEMLEDLQEKLLLLEKSCRNSAQTVSYNESVFIHITFFSIRK